MYKGELRPDRLFIFSPQPDVGLTEENHSPPLIDSSLDITLDVTRNDSYAES